MDFAEGLGLDDLPLPSLDDLLDDPMLAEAVAAFDPPGTSSATVSGVSERTGIPGSPEPSDDDRSGGRARSPSQGPATSRESAGPAAEPHSLRTPEEEAAAVSAPMPDSCSPIPWPEQQGGRLTQPVQGKSGGAEEELKRKARMLRNRESANLSRQRKKILLEEKEQQCSDLERQNKQLSGMVNCLMAENTALKHHLVATCHRSGLPLPVLPAPGSVPIQPGTPFGYSPSPIPGMCAAPKVAIQKIKPSRPAPATKENRVTSAELPTVVKAEPLAVDVNTRPPAKKRRRAAAVGGTTAMLALFCFFVFSGPNLPGLEPSAMLGSSPARFAALPASSLEALPMLTDGGGHGGGRVLQSLPPDDNAMPDPDFGNSSLWVQGNGTLGWQALPLQPNDKVVESLALQRLKELGPIAVYSDWDGKSGHGLGKNFPQFASSVLAGDGLMAPATCREVFSFDAASVSDPVQARRRLQSYMAGLDTFRGRSLGALPLPPIGGADVDGDADQDDMPRATFQRPRTMLQGESRAGCDGEEGDVVVSVMLPTKAPPVGDATDPAGFTSLDQLYVVVLKPSQTYTTYACGLNRSVLI